MNGSFPLSGISPFKICRQVSSNSSSGPSRISPCVDMTVRLGKSFFPSPPVATSISLWSLYAWYSSKSTFPGLPPSFVSGARVWYLIFDLVRMLVIHSKFHLNVFLKNLLLSSKMLYISSNVVFAWSSDVANMSMWYSFTPLTGVTNAKSSNARYPFFPAPRPTKIIRYGNLNWPSSLLYTQLCRVKQNCSHGNSLYGKCFSSPRYLSNCSLST